MNESIVMIVFITTLIILILLSISFLSIWVYKDAKLRNLNAVLWTVIVIFANPILGMILYFLIGRKEAKILCNNCNNLYPIESKFCNYCGTENSNYIAKGFDGEFRNKTDKNKKFIMLAIVALAMFYIVMLVMIPLLIFVFQF